MDLTEALDFVREHRRACSPLRSVTAARSCRTSMYAVGDDGVIRISITADRAKYTNLSVIHAPRCT